MGNSVEHYAEVCRARFSAVAREMSDLGLEQCPDVYDGIQMALLMELAAMLVLPNCTEEMFIEACTDVFRNAVAATEAPIPGQQ